MKSENAVDKVKGMSVGSKLLYGGAIATILGFFLPFMAGAGGMLIQVPYAWILFIVALAIPAIGLFMNDSSRKRDWLITLSEPIAVISVGGFIIAARVSSIMGAFLGTGVGMFDLLNVGSVFFIVGSVVQFIGALMYKV